MSTAYDVLIMGASYGSLLATKPLFAGHRVRLVCLPAEAEVINGEGTRVRLPVKGRRDPVEIDSRKLWGSLSADVPGAVDPADYDLVALAMQEPQYLAPDVRELLDAVAKARVPCMSIMNMPPLPYLKRIPGVATDTVRDCYTDATVWDGFDPVLMTLCSPDAQAFRPPEERVNVLQVTLPTNFKAARFESDDHTAMLRRMQAEIEAIRYDAGDGEVELPVKLKVHDSVFVPLAKWSMLLTGNYRCIQRDGARSIREAMHSDIEASRSVYDWVRNLCVELGASPDDLVPFEKYASAAQGLTRPSSAARALSAGAPPTSSGWTGWCNASRPRGACGPRPLTRSSPWSTPASRPTARRPPDPPRAPYAAVGRPAAGAATDRELTPGLCLRRARSVPRRRLRARVSG